MFTMFRLDFDGAIYSSEYVPCSQLRQPATIDVSVGTQTAAVTIDEVDFEKYIVTDCSNLYLLCPRFPLTLRKFDLSYSTGVDQFVA